MEAAAEEASLPVYTPRDEAKLGAPTVWSNVDTGEVGLRYESDLVILEAPLPSASGANAEAQFEAQAKQWEAGYVTSIDGNPAWVIPQDSRAQLARRAKVAPGNRSLVGQWFKTLQRDANEPLNRGLGPELPRAG